MIEIKKVTDPALAARICRENGVEWNPEFHVIATLEGERVLHCAVFSYQGETGEIYAISGFDGDILLLDGLCRAILNIMDINGVKTVFLPKKYREIAEYVGFEAAEHRYQLSLDGFFDCGCCKKSAF